MSDDCRLVILQVGFHVEGVPPSPAHEATLAEQHLQQSAKLAAGSPSPVIIPPTFQVVMHRPDQAELCRPAQSLAGSRRIASAAAASTQQADLCPLFCRADRHGRHAGYAHDLAARGGSCWSAAGLASGTGGARPAQSHARQRGRVSLRLHAVDHVPTFALSCPEYTSCGCKTHDDSRLV